MRTSLLLIGFVCALGAALALISHGYYGYSLFVYMPVLAGALAVMQLKSRTGWEAAGKGAAAAILALTVFLLIGAEGFLCVAMVAPIAIPLGAISGYAVHRGNKKHGTVALALLPLATLAWDTHAKPQVYTATTRMVINASADQVWKHVTAIPDIPEPTEWYFQRGISYPMRTRLTGSGIGANRYCDFITGVVEERITTWEPARLLRFTVTHTPAPMREWGLYGEMPTKHLDGYFISKVGEFRLSNAGNGRTLLEGTSWYQHGLWPGWYWKLWSDAIVHSVHRRVLDRIKTLSESSAR